MAHHHADPAEAEAFATLLKAVFGERHWQALATHHFNLGERSIRNFITSRSRIPSSLWIELHALAVETCLLITSKATETQGYLAIAQRAVKPSEQGANE